MQANKLIVKMSLLNKAITSVAAVAIGIIGCCVVTAEASTLRLGQNSNSTGLTVTQGDAAMRADKARQKFNVDGRGILIGVISDSFNNLGGAQTDIANGDLPSDIKVLQDFPRGGEDEARALMQIIHDVAPGAKFAFHVPTTLTTDSPTVTRDYADAIRKLADAGARIIVSDIGDPFDSMFQDGIVAQTIDSIAFRPGNTGVSFFASAGNEGRQSYESAFSSSGIKNPLNGGEFHDFDPGAGVDTFQKLRIPQGALSNFFFQWDSPFASLGSKGSNNDLDIFLYDSSGTKVLAQSTNSNIGDNPAEYFSFFNDGPTQEFNLAISKKDGPMPNLMKYIVGGGGGREFKIEEYDTKSSTAFGYSNASGAMAVGAVSYQETPEFGVNPARKRFFSSTGCVPILFDTSGNRLGTPECRKKPGIMAPDRVNNTFFGDDNEEDPDNFPNFSGTSAAAPHVAAVAALMLQMNPNLSPTQVYSILQQTASDMDDPSTPGFDRGFDFGTGYGFINAELAVSQAQTKIPEPSLLLGILIVGCLTRFARIQN